MKLNSILAKNDFFHALRKGGPFFFSLFLCVEVECDVYHTLSQPSLAWLINSAQLVSITAPCGAVPCRALRYCAVLCRAACYAVLILSYMIGIIESSSYQVPVHRVCTYCVFKSQPSALQPQPSSATAQQCSAVRCRAVLCPTVRCCAVLRRAALCFLSFLQQQYKVTFKFGFCQFDFVLVCYFYFLFYVFDFCLWELNTKCIMTRS